MGISALWKWRLTVPKTTKMMPVRPLMTNWRWLLETAMLFLRVIAPHSVHKSSHSLLGFFACVFWGRSRPLNRCPLPSPQVTSIWNKANLLSTNLGYLLAFEWPELDPPHIPFSSKSMWILESCYFVDDTSLFLNINIGPNRDKGNTKKVRNQQNQQSIKKKERTILVKQKY